MDRNAKRRSASKPKIATKTKTGSRTKTAGGKTKTAGGKTKTAGGKTKTGRVVQATSKETSRAARAKTRNAALRRCWWCGDDPLYCDYHDQEWGVPLHDETRLFEMLILEGAQAGLSWITILKKRENYRKAYRGFDPAAVARFTERSQQRLLKDAGIVRNRAKIAASVGNAKAFLELQALHGSFDRYIWGFVDGRPLQNRWKRKEQVPASTPLSDAISKELKKAGMKFVGSTIVYAYMQSIGMVNDHTTDCFRYKQLR